MAYNPNYFNSVGSPIQPSPMTKNMTGGVQQPAKPVFTPQPMLPTPATAPQSPRPFSPMYFPQPVQSPTQNQPMSGMSGMGMGMGGGMGGMNMPQTMVNGGNSAGLQTNEPNTMNIQAKQAALQGIASGRR